MLIFSLIIFLTKDISSSSEDYVGIERHSRLDVSQTDLIKCIYSIFSNIKSDQENGGAISTVYNIYVNSSYFVNCSAKAGGAIYSTTSSSVFENSFFHQCSAFQCGGFLVGYNDGHLNLFSNSICSCSSTYFAGFRSSGVTTSISSTNFTSNLASCASSFEIILSHNPVLSYLIQFNQTAHEKHAGCSFWQDKDLDFKKSVFSHLKISSYITPSIHTHSIAIWLDGENLSGKIHECSFLLCYSWTPMIPVIQCMNCLSITVDNCCFSNPRDYVFYGKVSIGNNNSYNSYNSCLMMNTVPNIKELMTPRNIFIPPLITQNPLNFKASDMLIPLFYLISTLFIILFLYSTSQTYHFNHRFIYK